MPSQSFSHRAVSRAPQETVWRALDLPATWEAIPGIDKVVDPVLEDGRLRGFSFESIAGGRRHRGEATPAGREEGRSMAWRVESSEVRGTIEVALKPADEGTSVLVTVDVESAGLLSALLFPALAAAIGRGLPEAVERFADELG